MAWLEVMRLPIGGNLTAQMLRRQTWRVTESRSITMHAKGYLRIKALAGGGSAGKGAMLRPRTGGNSSPWGLKVVEVQAGEIISLVIGAAGLPPSSNDTGGNKGGTTTISSSTAGILMSIQGGEAGTTSSSTAANAASYAAAVISVVTGADFWVPGVRAGDAIRAGTYAMHSGGAAPDLFNTGKGRGETVSSGSTWLNGRGGSIGADAGGIFVAGDFTDWGVGASETGESLPPGTNPSTASCGGGWAGVGGAPARDDNINPVPAKPGYAFLEFFPL